MRKLLEIAIHTEPKAWERTRLSAIGRFYTSPGDRAARDIIAHAVRRELRYTPMTVAPILLEVRVLCTPPTRMRAADRGVKENTARPDIDNYLKQVLDALTGVLYLDDKQVVRATVEKGYAWDGIPRWEIMAHQTTGSDYGDE